LNNELTAIIPVASNSIKVERLSKMLEGAHNNGINIVLIHDYSESKKTVIVEEIFKKYCGNKDTLISGQFGSAAVARNEGLKVCKTKWVCFWDSDDVVHAEKFNELMLKANLENCDIGVGLISVQAESGPTKVRTSDRLKKNRYFDLQIANFPAFTRMVFKLQKIKLNPFPAIKVGEDLVFLLNLEFSNSQIYLSNEVNYIYLVGATQQTTQKYKGNQMITRSLLITLLDLLKKKDFTNKRMALGLLFKIGVRYLSSNVFNLNYQDIRIMLKILIINIIYFRYSIVAICYLISHRPNVLKVIHNA
jgi:glycosyltransferase involved in cell wall biosynthesis